MGNDRISLELDIYVKYGRLVHILYIIDVWFKRPWHPRLHGLAAQYGILSCLTTM